MITAISGLPGTGKTHWIREQIAKKSEPVTYFSPQTESFPIDRICLQSEFPDLSILSVGEEEKLFNLAQTNAVYIELPWYLNLAAIDPLLTQLNCYRVALISSTEHKSEWQNWADEMILTHPIEGNKIIEAFKNNQLQIHRGNLTGEVLDFNSLQTFWLELTQGAYGEVVRVKGIFDILDGQYIYGEFIENLTQKDFQPLKFPLCLNGRPTRFSGIEIVGTNLNKQAIADTLGDFCLSDAEVSYYQQQVKQSLSDL
ncbi:MAG: hypothetical protein DSM107014_11670 [Gomphosphaeria aponina SAG 52.96 = DSM 107014]|uniref:GTP-binding protein n=1 Tax=Gomphosphaeria aponina SAG 52.96 = DSM 107014 TaxID=1521640 RepID=A0A941JTF9_9CHRO|nr:hypothetical protein [Gomphosphaeria aponina SAG 52.96 = DSM 107014]